MSSNYDQFTVTVSVRFHSILACICNHLVRCGLVLNDQKKYLAVSTNRWYSPNAVLDTESAPGSRSDSLDTCRTAKVSTNPLVNNVCMYVILESEIRTKSTLKVASAKIPITKNKTKKNSHLYLRNQSNPYSKPNSFE